MLTRQFELFGGKFDSIQQDLFEAKDGSALLALGATGGCDGNELCHGVSRVGVRKGTGILDNTTRLMQSQRPGKKFLRPFGR